jgi:dihydroorotase|tara:strand:- start:293 stop:1594 length:1302 start_codon:yes stop_codon:yes gene_type:complete
MSRCLIRGGRVIDPASGLDAVGDVWLCDGAIVAGPLEGDLDDELDAAGKIVCPGLIETQATLQEPGWDDDETIASGTAAAVAGGVTSVACLPETQPVVDNRAAVEFIRQQAERAGACHVFPLGAVTKNRDGQELAEIGQLVEGGAVALSDGKRPVANAEVMRRALEYARMFGRRIFHHSQVPELVAGGVMHEGLYSTLLGLGGMPAEAEEIMVARDVALAEMTGGSLHLMTISTAASVDILRRAKQRGVDVTGSVTPHHLVLTDAELQSFDANCKVDPPLRSSEHVEALVEGLVDGTIDVICSDHRPVPAEEKDLELDVAPFGIVGLETLLPLCVRALIDSERLDWPSLIALLTSGPARVLGVEAGSLAEGCVADVIVIDPDAEWTIDPAKFRSRCSNSPFAGWQVRGRVETVFVDGQRVFSVESVETVEDDG